MIDLAALAALHAELDASLEGQRAVSLEAGDETRVAVVDEKLRLNDQAYFVLCWGQFETGVNDRCRAVIRSAQSHIDWKRRRVWQMFNVNDQRLSGLRFEDRVALLLDAGAGPGSAYARVIGYYGLRNGIAHGRLRPDRVNVQDTVADFFQIQSQFA